MKPKKSRTSVTLKPQTLAGLKVDVRLLKRQAAILGKVVDNRPLTDYERRCLEGLWEFTHRVLDALDES